MTFDIEVGWALGLVLGTIRAGAFVAAGGLIPRGMPRTVRGTPALAFGLLIGHPLQGTLELDQLVTLAFMNAFIGVVLGWILGLALVPFQVAGSMLDISSGLSIGSLFDPETQSTPGPLARFVDLAGRTLIIIAGGLGVSAKVLAASVQAVALDGDLHAAGVVGPTAARALSRVMRAGLEVALPVVAVLFLFEVTLGLVSRVAPQVNAFLLGMPVKIMATFLLMGSLIAVFPATADRAVADALDTVRSLLRSFAG